MLEVPLTHCAWETLPKTLRTELLNEAYTHFPYDIALHVLHIIVGRAFYVNKHFCRATWNNRQQLQSLLTWCSTFEGWKHNRHIARQDERHRDSATIWMGREQWKHKFYTTNDVPTPEESDRLARSFAKFTARAITLAQGNILPLSSPIYTCFASQGEFSTYQPARTALATAWLSNTQAELHMLHTTSSTRQICNHDCAALTIEQGRPVPASTPHMQYNDQKLKQIQQRSQPCVHAELH